MNMRLPLIALAGVLLASCVPGPVEFYKPDAPGAAFQLTHHRCSEVDNIIVLGSDVQIQMDVYDSRRRPNLELMVVNQTDRPVNAEFADDHVTAGEPGKAAKLYHFELPGGDRTRFHLKGHARFTYVVEFEPVTGKTVVVTAPALTVEGAHFTPPSVYFTRTTEGRLIGLNC